MLFMPYAPCAMPCQALIFCYSCKSIKSKIGMSRSKALQYYILARLVLAPIMLLTITTVVFLLLRATPGDPADAILGGRAPESAKQQLRQQLGLTDPLWLQYLRYVGSLLQFNFGTSLSSSGQSVWHVIQQHFPATVELTVF